MNYIQAQALEYQEDLHFDQNVATAVQGGYNSIFATTPRTFTALNGSLTISAGSAELDRIEILTPTCDDKIPIEQWPSGQHANVSYATPPPGYGSVIAWAVVTIGRVGGQSGKVTVKNLQIWEEASGQTSPIQSRIYCPDCDANNKVWGYTLEKSLWRDPAAWSKPNEGDEFSISQEKYVVVPAENYPTRVYHFWNTEWPRQAAKQGAKYYVTADALIEGNAMMQIGADYWQSTNGGSNVEAMNSDWYCASAVWQTLSIGQ